MKKFLKYLLTFTIISTVITYFLLSALDKYIYKIGQTSYVENNTKSTDSSIEARIKLEDDIEDLQFAYNNKYYAFLKDSKVKINYVKDGSEYSVIEDEDDICYFKLLYDKNLIVYITSSVNTNGRAKLDIKTYDIETKRQNEYNTFYVNNFSKIKDMNMSPLINIIYINIETKTKYKTDNVIYRVDLFNSMSQVKSGIIVNNMIMLQKKDRVYYEDEEYNIYSSSSYWSMFKLDVEMIGIDKNDYLYFIDKETKSTVYIVSNSKIIDTIKLNDTGVVKTYTNNVGVYIVYENYVINVASDTPYERIGRLSKYVEFEAIKGNTMYLRTKDNILVTTNVKVEDTKNTKNSKESSDSTAKSTSTSNTTTNTNTKTNSTNTNTKQ